MSLVFISHVAEDSARAVQVATGIEDAGYTSWYYERDSLPGPTYLDQILAALARASAMIVLVSPAALASWQIDREVVQAYERGLPFLPLLFGLSHDEMHKARPAWAMAFGAAVSLPLPTGDVAPVLPRIVAGLRWLEDQADRHALPPRAPTSAPHSSVPAAPPTAPGEPITRLAAPSLLDKLPLPPTPLIGREREVEHVMALLWQDAVRLVTLTGPGGSGKTRLALQIAAESRPAFPDGVVFVNLAPLSDAALVLPAIAQALGVTEAGGQPLREAVPAFLHARRLLLVLDNYEQVIEAAPVAADLLASCPLLSVLATSRAPLRLRGEHEIAVAPLAVPDPTDLPDAPALAKVAAVALFVARAQEVKADFALTQENAPAIAALCARLDGLPLALELAAARIKLFAPSALLARLDHRLVLLTGGARDLPARQQTLRATIDWSYRLLAEPEQTLFARLCVFAGGRTLEAIEAVCNPAGDVDVLAGVEALIEQSLLRQSEVDGETRVVMLETIQEYARERLEARGEAESIRRAHAAYFLALAEEARTHLAGPEQATWLARLAREHDNVRAALRWAGESGESALELRLATAMWRFWDIRGYLSEGRGWLEGALARGAAASEAERAGALAGAGRLAGRQGDYAHATALLEESLALSRGRGDQRSVADMLHALGLMAASQGDYARAIALYEESLTLWRPLGDTQRLATTLSNLGNVISNQGDYARAIALYEESLALRRELGDQRGIGASLNNLGSLANQQGDVERARALYEESLALWRTLGDRRGIGIALNNLAEAALKRSDYERAATLYEESLAVRRELGDKRGIASALIGLGELAMIQGDGARARALHEESLGLARTAGDKQGVIDALTALGYVAHESGQDTESTSLCAESLRLARDLGNRPRITRCIAGLALAAAGLGQPARAARLLGAATALCAALGVPWSAIEQARQAPVLMSARTALGDAAFEAAWAEGQAMSLVLACDTALQQAETAADTPART